MLRNSVLTILLFAFTFSEVYASHIMGSYIEMKEVPNRVDEYEIRLFVFIDALGLQPSGAALLQNSSMNARLFRKRDNRFSMDIRLIFSEFKPLEYENAVCANSFGLSVRRYQYKTTIKLPGATYNDQQGYYIAWEYCCRNPGIINIKNAGTAGLVGYLEFPALTSPDGRHVTFSSPEIDFRKGIYACLMEPFEKKWVVKDNNGDILEYKTATPYQGHNDENNFDNIAKSAPYPEIRWNNGFSLDNVITGSPPLNINSNNGQFSFTPTQLGTYIFTFQVNKIREGKIIGTVRFDFQLPVIDCPNQQPPPPIITHKGINTQQIEKCENDTITLKIDNNTEWAHQWQKDGIDIVNATQSELKIIEPGNYTVFRTFKNRCGNIFTSAPVDVSIKKTSFKPKIVTSRQQLCAKDSALLSVVPQSNYEFEWFYNKKNIGYGTELKIVNAGKYIVRARDKQEGCIFNNAGDTINITQSNSLIVTPFSSINRTVCQGDSMEIGINEQSLSYEWNYGNSSYLKTSENKIWVHEEGIYQLIAKDANGCTSNPLDFSLSFYPAPVIRFDSIPTVCLPSSVDRLQLVATPSGGVFSGSGVQGTSIELSGLTTGVYPISYNYKTPNGCTAQAIQSLVIAPAFSIYSPEKLVVNSDMPTSIHIQASIPDIIYKWSPDIYLDKAFGGDVIITPQDSVHYVISAQSPEGCIIQKNLRIIVRHLLFIPDVFTPNNDGINDYWLIKNIQYFPNAEVSIFNRWGEKIYHSFGYNQPWDGTSFQVLSSPSIFTYVIHTNGEDPHTYRGQILLAK